MRKILLDLKKGPRHWIREVMQAKMTPWEVAFGFSVGLFLGMLALPILNLLLFIVAMAVMRINKLAAMLGYVMTIAPLSPFVYLASLKVGFIVLRKGSVVPDIENISLNLIKEYGITFALGNVLLSAISSAAAFIVIYGVASLIKVIKKKNEISPPNDKVM